MGNAIPMKVQSEDQITPRRFILACRALWLLEFAAKAIRGQVYLLFILLDVVGESAIALRLWHDQIE